jgi:NADPH-dependent 2,4-dienoyl-CoA reductase/sulfur reductase-like enzyme
VEDVTLSDGRRLPADLIVVSVGSAPAVGWLRGTGVDVSDGIQCDHTCAMIGQQDVVAAGDIASWYNPLYERRMRVEHWTNAIEQGMYAGQRLLGVHDPQGFTSAPYFWSDQYGIRLQSIGSASGHDEAEVLLEDGERLVVAYGAAGRLVGIAGLHSGAMVMSYRSMITQRASMDEVRAKAGRPVGPAAAPLVRDK